MGGGASVASVEISDATALRVARARPELAATVSTATSRSGDHWRTAVRAVWRVLRSRRRVSRVAVGGRSRQVVRADPAALWIARASPEKPTCVSATSSRPSRHRSATLGASRNLAASRHVDVRRAHLPTIRRHSAIQEHTPSQPESPCLERAFRTGARLRARAQTAGVDPHRPKPTTERRIAKW
jgi:hypothetical protein